MPFYEVKILKVKGLREIPYIVESFSPENAKAEAARIFQEQFGFYPDSGHFVSVEETDKGRLIEVTIYNKRGKQLIKEHGSIWRIVKGPVPMQCFNNALGYRIETIEGCGYSRNIKVDWDDVFTYYTFLPDDK
jgi:hypothetical protein